MQNKSKKRRGRLRVFLIAAGALLGLCIVAAGTDYVLDAPSRAELAALTIGDVNIASLSDGTYTGVFHGERGSLRDTAVRATVEGGRLTDIQTVNGTQEGSGTSVAAATEPITAELYGEVIAAQSLQVDAVGGATLTSRAHLKALENALRPAQTESTNKEGAQ